MRHDLTVRTPNDSRVSECGDELVCQNVLDEHPGPVSQRRQADTSRRSPRDTSPRLALLAIRLAPARREQHPESRNFVGPSQAPL